MFFNGEILLVKPGRLHPGRRGRSVVFVGKLCRHINPHLTSTQICRDEWALLRTLPRVLSTSYNTIICQMTSYHPFPKFTQPYLNLKFSIVKYLESSYKYKVWSSCDYYLFLSLIKGKLYNHVTTSKIQPLTCLDSQHFTVSEFI